MSIVNTDQAERWNSGEDVAHWITNQARYDRMNEPFAALILTAAALRPGSHVLDVGCGCGGMGGGGSVEDAVRFLRTGSMGRTMLAGADADTVDRAVASVRAVLAPYADADGVRMGAAVWLVQATAS
jgi:hypothetical protein